MDREPQNELNYPPVLAWQGCLTQGETAVLITPTIWEFDGGKDVYDAWLNWGKDVAKKLSESKASWLAGEKTKVILEAVNLGLDIALTTSQFDIRGNAYDRPIGMQKSGNTSTFSPKSILLNYDTAQYLINNQLNGIGNGVIAVEYSDDKDYGGHYILYVKVESRYIEGCSPKPPVHKPEEQGGPSMDR